MITMVQEQSPKLVMEPRLRQTLLFECPKCGATPMIEQCRIVRMNNCTRYYCPHCETHIHGQKKMRAK